jgi:hypothetical protein
MTSPDGRSIIMSGTGSPLVVRLLSEQRKRCLATILNNAESALWWARLSDIQQNTFREQVRTALAVFYDLTRDVLKVTEDDSLRNDLALELIRSIHTQQAQIKQSLDRST